MTKTQSRPNGHGARRCFWLGFVLSAMAGNTFARNPYVTTEPSDINNFGVIVGNYSSTVSPQPSAFIDTKYTHFVNFVDPLAIGMTNASGVNDQGAVVGTYYTGSSVHGFLYSGGAFNTIDYPNSDGTRLGGINDSGYIIGLAYKAGTVQSFEYGNGIFSIIIDPQAVTSGTAVVGINNLGAIVGSSNIAGVNEGFVYSAGVFTHLIVPGSIYTSAGGINDSGSVVGSFVAVPHGFAKGYIYSAGNFTTIEFPGAAETLLSGINNAGVVTGFAFDVQTGRGLTDAGFVYQNGVFTVISDLGHSNPIPEPASWTLMIVGLGGLGTALRQSRRVRRRAA